MASPFTQEQVNAYVNELQKLVESGQISQDVANRTIANQMRNLESADAGVAVSEQLAEAYPGLSQQDIMDVYNQIVAPEILAGVAGVRGGLSETSPEIFDIFAKNYEAALAPPAEDTSGIMGAGVEPPAPSVDLSGLTPEQQAFAQTLPVNLQDDYVASVGAGLGDEASGATVQSLADLLKGRGLSFEEAAQSVGLTPESPNYEEAVRAYYGLTPSDSSLIPGQGPGGAGFTPGGFQYTPFDYTNMPAAPEGAVPSIFSVGGVFGPGQGMPQVPYVEGVDTGLGTQQPAPATGTTGQTLVSPGITTYAYPQPFGDIDIFGRPTATTPTAYTPPPANNTNNTGS